MRRWLKVLLKAGADIEANSLGKTPLHHWAPTGGPLGETPLHWAAAGGHEKVVEVVEVVERLFKAGADIEANSLATPLHCAAFYGHEKVVEVLRKFGGPVREPDQETKRPWMRHQHSNGFAVLVLLLPMIHSESCEKGKTS